MRFLLVYPPILRAAGVYSTPLPIGLLQVAAHLRNAGHVVRVLNLELGGALHTTSIRALRNAYAANDPAVYVMDPQADYRCEFRAELGDFQPEVVGFSVATEQRDAAAALARDARRWRKDVRLEYGGVHARTSEWGRAVAAAALHCDPACDLVAGQNPPESFGSILTSHGCPHACTFCSSPRTYGRRLTEYPLERVRRRIEDARRLGAQRFHLMDDTITLRRARAMQIASLMADLGLPWRTQTRVDDLVRHADLATLFKQAGCTQLTFGVESGSPALLQVMRKRITVDQVLRAVDVLNAAELPYTANFMIGYPGETDDDVQMTMHLIRRMQPRRVLAGSVVPYPGSELHVAHPGFVLRAVQWPRCRWSPFDPGFLREPNGDRVQGPSAAAVAAFYELVEQINDHAPTGGTFTTTLGLAAARP